MSFSPVWFDHMVSDSRESRILILGAAAFYYGGDGSSLDAGLFDAHDLIKDRIGRRK